MEKIRNLDEIIKEIENCDYIDCHKDEIFDDYQYENILYYLKQYKKQQEIIDKAIEYINTHKRKDEFLELNEWQTRDLLQILEDKEV